MRNRLLSVIFLICSMITCSAQDIITFRSGMEERGRVEEVGTSEIKYHRESNPNGPIYAIDKSEVSKIVYANGTMDEFYLKDDTKGLYFRPDICIGALDGFAWGGGLSVGYNLNSAISTGLGGLVYGTVSEGIGANAYGFFHAKFNRTENHWFGELRSGCDFCWLSVFFEPMVGYEFKAKSIIKGTFQVSYGTYIMPYEGQGYLINLGYRL